MTANRDYRPPTANATGLLKQVGMPACALEDDFLTDQFVDEQPIRFDMAFTPILEVAPQWMVAIAFRQHFLVDERRQDLFQLGKVFAAPLL